MNILIVTPHFYPENFRINDFAKEFVKRGHGVTVLTAIPDYPDGKFFDGYGLFKRARETHNGVKEAKRKMKQKSADFIVLNYANEKNAGFDSSTNRVTIFSKNGKSIELKKDRKDRIAKKIIEYILRD